jgi:hypothetical protein
LIKGVEDIVEIENIEDFEFDFRFEEHSKQFFMVFLTRI